MRCEICGKDIKLKDAYSPIRYQIAIVPNAGLTMLTNLQQYEFVCQKCGNEIKRFITDMKEEKTTKAEVDMLLVEEDDK